MQYTQSTGELAFPHGMWLVSGECAGLGELLAALRRALVAHLPAARTRTA